MPAVSKKQQRFFGYLLSNPEERKKKGISKKAAKDFAQDVKEVAPPGWGHTKAEKEKTKPWKPKSKIGGTAAAFKRALDDGRFKGLPGSKTKKEKTADMFKLMWSMKKKGDKPHYKPGTDKKYKKYQEESVNEAVKGQDTESRKEGAKERASEKRAHDAWKPGTKKRPLYSTTRHTKSDAESYATQQKQSIKWHDKRTKGKFIPGTTSEEKKLTPMQDNNLFGNAYAGSYEDLKKEIGSKKKPTKPAVKEGSFADYMAQAQAARERQQQKQDDRKKRDAEFVDRKKHGVKFYDKKGRGRIIKGRKVYD